MKSKTLRRILITGCVAAIAGGAVLVGFHGEIREGVNTLRAERLLEKARTAFANEEWAEASRIGSAAHYLDPENREIERLVARALLKQRNASSIDWWKRVLYDPDIPVDELRNVTYAVLKQGDLPGGLEFLNRLMELDGENPETQRLWLYALGLQRRLGSARQYAELTGLGDEKEIPQEETIEETAGDEDAEAPPPPPLNLSVAVDTATAEETEALAVTLSRKGEWGLLQRLMENRLREDPDNPEYLVKLLGACYYSGNQVALYPLLERLEQGALESQPVWESFLDYLHLLLEGFSVERHKRLEELLASYPEVFEYRLVLGLSFHLKGDRDLARGLLEDMPEMPPETARHLRVAVAILGESGSGLLLPGERDELLPRERYLLSPSGQP